MKVIQCWDDGVTTDIRLIEILKKYDAKATFNLCLGKNGSERQLVGQFNDIDIVSLAYDELYKTYKDFDVANHSLTHPGLPSLSQQDLEYEIVENKARLEALFNRKVSGFCYPFGAVNSEVRNMVEQTGHQYARTVEGLKIGKVNQDLLLLKPHCHFLAPDFWACYEAAKASGVFYFWGHSFEMHTEKMWQEFENKIAIISNDPNAEWDSISNVYK